MDLQDTIRKCWVKLNLWCLTGRWWNMGSMPTKSLASASLYFILINSCEILRARMRANFEEQLLNYLHIPNSFFIQIIHHQKIFTRAHKNDECRFSRFRQNYLKNVSRIKLHTNDNNNSLYHKPVLSCIIIRIRDTWISIFFLMIISSWTWHFIRGCLRYYSDNKALFD